MKIHSHINPLRGMSIVLLTVFLPLSFLLSCNKDKKDMVEVFFNPQTSYTYKTTNSHSLISDDAGITRYKMVTATWLIFGKASEPFWYFPDGIYLEIFDTLLNVEASLKADTAYRYEKRNLWEAKGNVDIMNLQGRRFQTSQVFWDEQNKKIYSDSSIIITEDDKITTGIGFIANEDLSEYQIRTVGGTIPIELQRQTTETDSITPVDSISNEAFQEAILSETDPHTP